MNEPALQLEAADDALIETVEIASIKRPEDLRVRQKGTNKSTVSDYARAMEALRDDPEHKGKPFPPVICYRTKKGGPLLLADGAHRIEARLQIGEATIEAEIRIGSKRDALEAALESAKQFGLRFSNADKRRSVALLLKDPVFGNQEKYSDHDLAAKVGVLRISPTVNTQIGRWKHPRAGSHLANVSADTPPRADRVKAANPKGFGEAEP